MVLNICKLEIAFECQTRFSNSFLYKDPIIHDLIVGRVVPKTFRPNVLK